MFSNTKKKNTILAVLALKRVGCDFYPSILLFFFMDYVN